MPRDVESLVVRRVNGVLKCHSDRLEPSSTAKGNNPLPYCLTVQDSLTT